MLQQKGMLSPLAQKKKKIEEESLLFSTLQDDHVTGNGYQGVEVSGATQLHGNHL